MTNIYNFLFFFKSNMDLSDKVNYPKLNITSRGLLRNITKRGCVISPLNEIRPKRDYFFGLFCSL